MKQFLATRKFFLFPYRLAGIIAIFLFSLSQSVFSQKVPSYTFTLKNQSQLNITKIVLIPYGFVQIHTPVNLPFDKEVSILRPECDKMKINIIHEKGSFSFPFTNFENKKNTALTLTINKDTIPTLRFEEGNKEFITGDNSDWQFPQILGAIPFHLGFTSIENAKAFGATPTQHDHVLETTLLWKNRSWEVNLTFSGNTPDSKLIYLEMTTAKDARGETPSHTHDALMSHNYVYYSTVLKNTEQDLYVSIPLARKLEKANMNGDDLTKILTKYYNEIIVQSFPQKKIWYITMTFASDFVEKNVNFSKS